MRSKNSIKEKRARISQRLGKIMKCLFSGEQLRADEMLTPSESLATKDYTVSGYPSHAAEIDQKPDTGNIEEESPLCGREVVSEFERLSGVAVLEKMGFQCHPRHCIYRRESSLQQDSTNLDGNRIKAYTKAMEPVDEQQYEIGLDVHGVHDGP
ncbi:hypothetical protein U1Q18_005554 [Sarracenia purpurea var. burkii]